MYFDDADAAASDADAAPQDLESLKPVLLGRHVDPGKVQGVVAVPPQNISLPPKPRDAGHFFDYLKSERYTHEASPEFKAMMEKLLGGGQQSYSTRSIEIMTEDGKQSFHCAGFTSTRVSEIKDLIYFMTELDPRNLQVMSKKGAYWRHEPDTNQVSSKVKIKGLKSFERPKFQYQKPILIIGAGFGGIGSAIRLLWSGREDFVIMEKYHDFGGGSWIQVANKQTKLQTEKATYHATYIDAAAPIPQYLPTNPSRDQILQMFRREAREYGLDCRTLFNTVVRQVDEPVLKNGDLLQHLGQRAYNVHYGPAKNDVTKTMQAQFVIAWPGNLSYPREVDLVGEDSFDGYIEYGSAGRTDYSKVEGKDLILYGHGAFMIENCRTVIEYGVKKFYIVCRKKNLTTPKVASWLISQTTIPASAQKLLEVMEPMYKLAGLSPWSYPSVSTDDKRTFCRIDQDTVFGVTDIYFLALYYKKAELVCSPIKRLSRQMAHLVNNKKIKCQVIIKVLGIAADPKVDKFLCVDHMCGLWVNSDPMRLCISNGLHVSASNFGTFSVGPGIAHNSALVQYFVDCPSDFAKVRDLLPCQRAAPEKPAYALTGRHFMMTGVILGQNLPLLSIRTSGFDQMKSTKQHLGHPLKEYIEEVRSEWEMYCEMIGYDDIPPPPYPYTEGMVADWIESIKTDAFAKWSG